MRRQSTVCILVRIKYFSPAHAIIGSLTNFVNQLFIQVKAIQYYPAWHKFGVAA